jgi:hypothetical protein
MTPDQPSYEDDERRILAMRWVVDQLDYARLEARKIVAGERYDTLPVIVEQDDLYPVAFGFLEAAVTSMIAVLSNHLPAPYGSTDARS